MSYSNQESANPKIWILMLKTNRKGTNILSLARFANYLMLKNVVELNRLFWSVNTTLDDLCTSAAERRWTLLITR